MSKPAGKIILAAPQYAQCPVLNETPEICWYCKPYNNNKTTLFVPNIKNTDKNNDKLTRI